MIAKVVRSTSRPEAASFQVHMSRKYDFVRFKSKLQDGSFADYLQMAIVEMSSLGEQRFDIAGYPYEHEDDAFARDWASLAQDFRIAVETVTKQHDEGSEQTTEDSEYRRAG